MTARTPMWIAFGAFIGALSTWAGIGIGNTLLDDDPPPAPTRPAWTASCDGPIRIYHDNHGTVTAAAVIGSGACEGIGGK